LKRGTSNFSTILEKNEPLKSTYSSDHMWSSPRSERWCARQSRAVNRTRFSRAGSHSAPTDPAFTASPHRHVSLNPVKRQTRFSLDPRNLADRFYTPAPGQMPPSANIYRPLRTESFEGRYYPADHPFFPLPPALNIGRLSLIARGPSVDSARSLSVERGNTRPDAFEMQKPLDLVSRIISGHV